jgi:hypothetical protein
MVLSSVRQQMLGSNSTFHLLPVTVTAPASTGPKLSFVIHLARSVWHCSRHAERGGRAGLPVGTPGACPGQSAENCPNHDESG